MQYGQVLLVDNGGFFPEEPDSLYRDKAWFLMDGAVLLGTDATGMSEKELKYGRGWLLAQLKRSRLPMVCANVWDKTTKKTLVQPYTIVRKGTVNVGIFALTSDKVDMGPARDSITVEDPAVAAQRTVAEMRKKGATVVVLLSSLGKVESEDLVTAVDGIDVLVAGRNVPVVQRGRMIKNTIACYGGEQGQHIGRTIVTLDAGRRMTTGENDVFVLGPEVGEKPEILQLVKSFNDAFNDKMRKIEKERAARAALQTGGETNAQAQMSADHYVGMEVCIRCHQPEYQQWLKTGHAKAWETLVEDKKESTPECIGCHVVGYKQPGGFQTADDAPKLADVQCENCHGMGTQHEAYATVPQKVTEATCVSCHNATTSPNFSFAVFQPHVVHRPPAVLPPLPVNPAKMKMKQGTMGGSK
ncbi:MAG: hypothetical protein RL721_97 [Candidatus Eisenbacteria bacterium]